jgi:excisionase family DNA binding protein
VSRMLLTVSEAVLITGASRASIFTAIRDEKLKSIKLAGRRRRIRVADLETWIGAPLNLPSAQ